MRGHGSVRMSKGTVARPGLAPSPVDHGSLELVLHIEGRTATKGGTVGVASRFPWFSLRQTTTDNALGFYHSSMKYAPDVASSPEGLGG